MVQPPAPPARTSIVIVSRHRPQALERCLTALSRQDHPAIEIVLVADPGSVDICPDLPLKRCVFDQPNIPAARNEGIALSAGEVIAFIDDDALAVPGWASALTAPFADSRVLAAAGFTRGPDGLSWQARAERLTASGQTRPIGLDGAALLPVEGGEPVNTIGTNCAFRRDALLRIGGFDPAYGYYLDESDVNMRMAARFPQALTAVVPQAQVIHGLAPGADRKAGGVPGDLTRIGRSAAIFARRHGGGPGWVRESQRRRLLRHMLAGRLDPCAVRPLLATLERGLAEGRRAVPAPLPPWDRPDPPAFRPLPMRPLHEVFLAGWHWQARSLRARAAAAVAEGALAMILLLTPGFLPHRMLLTEGGWWEQRGGLWGASRPGDSPVFLTSWTKRISRERGNLLDLSAK
ncbi:glycosyl transferase [Paracoccus halophilus]|nr:glycosyltransferase family 2 protein [Paracoccus halophilus]KGJ05559.1 glycosyl transferase [Paracoccus halophilus]